MRNSLVIPLILLAILTSGCGNRQNKNNVNTGSPADSIGMAEIVFSEYMHDFGQVKEGEKVACVFNFENEGTGDLIIANVTTSCGCTVPKYETKPISPGEKGTLEVVFNTSGYDGVQTKTIQVKSNATTQFVVLKISTEVISSKN